MYLQLSQTNIGPGSNYEREIISEPVQFRF